MSAIRCNILSGPRVAAAFAVALGALAGGALIVACGGQAPGPVADLQTTPATDVPAGEIPIPEATGGQPVDRRDGTAIRRFSGQRLDLQLPTPQVLATGELSVLSYNVAGLPLGLSSSKPAQNTPLISPMLNVFDLALVQEDFGFHAALAADAEHPYQSEPMETSLLSSVGDGLNRFAQTPFSDFERVKWNVCNGFFGDKSDCLTPKGFSFARHTLAEGVEVDIYNSHFDAGRDEGDVAARADQVQQLVDFIAANSEGRAVMVGGDTNLKDHPPEDEEVLQSLLDGAGLLDACRVLSCDEPFRIDRLLFRSSDAMTLTPIHWEVDMSFVDADGEQLSDHEPVSVWFEWQLRRAGS